MKRPIRTHYYNGQKVVHVNAALHPGNAVRNAVEHLQENHYKSTHCEVYSVEDGTLWAVLRMTTKRLEIIYKRDVSHRTEE